MGSIVMTFCRSMILKAVTILLGTAISLAFAEIAARVILPHWQDYASERFMSRVPVPGWGSTMMGVPGFDGWFAQNNGDFRVPVRIDSRGLRNGDDAIPEGALWGIGDSFTFGWGVKREEIFASVAAEQLGLPFFSVASPGTDLCGYQALLAKAALAAKPSAVLLGLTIENDVSDYNCAANVDTVTKVSASWGWLEIKGWLMAHSALYNFTATTLKRSPVVLDIMKNLGVVEREMAQNWHKPLHPAHTVQSTAGAVVKLKSMLPQDVPFAVVLIPARFDLLASNSDWSKGRIILRQALEQAGLTVVDPYNELLSEGVQRAHFPHDGHWSPRGHEIAGTVAAQTLKPLLSKDVSQ